MAITSGFFNSKNGDRLYNAAQIGKYLQYIVGSGVFPYVSTSLQVLADDGMTVEVQPGRAMMDHHYMDNDAPITLTLAAGGSQDRIDAIVMYVDMTERACGIIIKEGTPAAAPVAPAMTRTDVRKEYMLAKVYVTKLSSSLTQSSITDTRADSTVCGWVTGLIKQVDTSTLFLQWQTAYEEEYARTQEYLAAQQAAWQAFFDSVTHDNVLPAPALTQVGYVMTVNETGDGYTLTPSGLTDSTLTADGTAADAAATGAAIKNARPVNLLDNSDFRNPVNQREFLSGTTIGGWTYFIDRWRSCDDDTTVTLSTDGIATTQKIYQPLSGLDYLVGKKVTAAVGFADGKIICGSFTLEKAGSWKQLLAVNDGAAYLHFVADKSNYWEFTFYSPNTISWAALYDGEYTIDNLPAYHPKGYAAELMECQRYFYCISGTAYPCLSMAIASMQTYGFISTPVKMRIAPTITYKNLTVRKGITDIADVIEAAALLNGSGLSFSVKTEAGKLTTGETYLLRLSSGNLTFSADL